MTLSLLNYIVGLSSFWNLTAPAIALGVFLLGLLAFAASKRQGGARAALTLLALGLVFFLVACAVDGTRNVHDVNQLTNAARDRYGITLNYVQATDLFGSGNHQSATLDGATATAYGASDLDIKGATEHVFLYRLTDGTFELGVDGKELAR